MAGVEAVPPLEEGAATVVVASIAEAIGEDMILGEGPIVVDTEADHVDTLLISAIGRDVFGFGVMRVAASNLHNIDL